MNFLFMLQLISHHKKTPRAAETQKDLRFVVETPKTKDDQDDAFSDKELAKKSSELSQHDVIKEATMKWKRKEQPSRLQKTQKAVMRSESDRLVAIVWYHISFTINR